LKVLVTSKGWLEDERGWGISRLYYPFRIIVNERAAAFLMIRTSLKHRFEGNFEGMIDQRSQ